MIPVSPSTSIDIPNAPLFAAGAGEVWNSFSSGTRTSDRSGCGSTAAEATGTDKAAGADDITGADGAAEANDSGGTGEAAGAERFITERSGVAAGEREGKASVDGDGPLSGAATGITSFTKPCGR